MLQSAFLTATTDTRPPVWLLVGTGMLCTLVTVVFARLAYGLILPAMREDLGLSYPQAANLGTVTAMGYLVLVMAAGMIAARFGARLTILAGLALAVASFVGLALSSSYALLMLLMVLLGFATAFAYTPLISLLGAWYPEKRGAVIGMANSGVGMGMLFSGLVVPVIMNRFPVAGWRYTWGLFALLGALTLLLAWFSLRNPPGLELKTELADRKDKGVYRNPHVIVMGLIYGIVGLTYIVQSIFMVSFALESGLSTELAGSLVALMGLLSIFAGPAWGWAADRMGHARALLICSSIAAVGTVLPVLQPDTLGFGLHYFLLGISVTGLFTSILAASTTTVMPQHAAVAVSFVTLFFAIGQLAGPAAAGLLIAGTGGFHSTFMLSSWLMVASMGLCWLSGYTVRK